MSKVIFLLSTVCFFAISCTSIPVNTDPPGAKIFVDNEFAGISPCKITPGEFSDSIEIRIEKPGYRTIAQIVSKGQDQLVTSYGTNSSVTSSYSNIIAPTAPRPNYIMGTNNTFSTSYGYNNSIIEGTWPNMLNFKLEKEEAQSKSD